MRRATGFLFFEEPQEAVIGRRLDFAESRRVGDLGEDEAAVGPTLLVKGPKSAEIGIAVRVAVQDEHALGRIFSCGAWKQFGQRQAEGAGRAERLGLDRVIEREAAVPVAERFADLFAAVTGEEHRAFETGLDQLVQQVGQKRLALDFGENLGPIADDAAQSRAEPAGKNRTDHTRHAAFSASTVGQGASLPLPAENIPRIGKLAACPTFRPRS